MGSLRFAEAAVANADIVTMVLRDVSTMVEENVHSKLVSWVYAGNNRSERTARTDRFIDLCRKWMLVQEHRRIWDERTENWARGVRRSGMNRLLPAW
jgi:hypothetical protein